MRIGSLQLKNFRNYEELNLELDPGTNLFYGDNAQGKTNILEAVYLCGTTKSHRTSKDREMIKFDQDEAHIRMNILKNEADYRVDMHLRKSKSKGIAINGLPIKRASELIGLGNFVFFSPEDLNIIKNGPAERRRFLDMQLCQLNAVYVSDLANYNRILNQRGKLLRDLSYRPSDEGTLDIWDEQLVNYGARIIETRENYVKLLNDVIGDIHLKLSGGKEKLSVGYDRNTSVEDFASQLRTARDRDVRQKMTTVGPHRDDLTFTVSDLDIRRFGSQGQQRTTALSLKLSEIELVKKLSSQVPVLLLDDVLSELDSNRQHFLLESISHIQTLITGTGVDDFAANHFKIDKLFNVKNGVVQEDING